jgi:hypothetical protein
LAAQSGVPVTVVRDGQQQQVPLNRLTQDELVSLFTSGGLRPGDFAGVWTDAGLGRFSFSGGIHGLRAYLNEQARSTDPNLRSAAQQALPEFEQARAGQGVTNRQARLVLDVLRADVESRWASGMNLAIDSSFKGLGAPSPYARDLADAANIGGGATRTPVQALQQHIRSQLGSADPAVRSLAEQINNRMANGMPPYGTPERQEVFRLITQLLQSDGTGPLGNTQRNWRALTSFVGKFANSNEAGVSSLARDLQTEMRRGRPEPGSDRDAAIFSGILELLDRDRASPWRVSDRAVEWQTVYRPDRSTISQYIQDHPTNIAINTVPLGPTLGLSVGPVGIQLPLPTRQVYMEWSEKNNGAGGTGFIRQLHPADTDGHKLFAQGRRPDLVYDPSNPERPWILNRPINVKLTAQTETPFGAAITLGPDLKLPGTNVGGGFGPFIGGAFIFRQIRYLGSEDGRPGYMLVQPMRLTDAEARFVETAFSGGVNHYHGEGKRVGPVEDGERYLFRNYLTRPFWTLSDQNWWRRKGIFQYLPEEYSLGPQREQMRTDVALAGQLGLQVLLPVVTYGSMEGGPVMKYVSLRRGNVQPHPETSPAAQEAVSALSASKARWTEDTLSAMRAYLDTVAQSSDAAYREAGERMRSVLPERVLPSSAMANYEVRMLNQLLLEDLRVQQQRKP